MRKFWASIFLFTVLVFGAVIAKALPPRPGVRGEVFTGNNAVPAARVFLLAVAIGNDRAAPSTSLIQQGVGQVDIDPGPTNGFRYVISNSNGRFYINQIDLCTPGQQVYLYAQLSGDSPSAVTELAALGICPSSHTFAGTYAHVKINEVTTVAAAYALAPYAFNSTHVSYDGQPAQEESIRTSFAEAKRLVDVQTGDAIAPPEAGSQFDVQKLHVVANALNMCASPTEAANLDPDCLGLFRPGRLSTTQRVSADTASYTIEIARHPTANVHPLFVLSGRSNMFTPTPTEEPKDLTLGEHMASPLIRTPSG